MYLSLYLRICAKKSENVQPGWVAVASPLLATRAGLDENEDRAVPVELAVPAVPHNQPNKSHQREGEEEEEYLDWRTFEVKAWAWKM